jgi:single-stranded-DNA-specific exonuclease
MRGVGEKRWVFAPADRPLASRLAGALRISPLAATLLVNRGVREPGDARAFLHPDLSGLRDPMRFEGMKAAVDRLEQALRAEEKVAVFGDYDVDGTSGTAILVKLFALLGRPVAWRVPHRVRDGYGLNAGAIDAFAAEGVRILITVDCGTLNHAEIGRAKAAGIDVIVLDHHEPGATLPPALAVINPKLPGSGYGFTGLCSAGISFKLAWALAERTSAKRRPGFDGFILDAMGLAALGTVADVCPLVDENRLYVRFGLEALRACRGRGLRELLARAKVDGKALETFDISFKLAPRLNALGRIGEASDCVELLVTDDESRIAAILETLEKSNRRRKGVEDEIYEQACAQVEETGGADGAIVVADERWHLGVVGIVAARLVDRFYRPAFVLAMENGRARGSARSIEGVALHEALQACHDLLLTHGGHAMAAGLSLETAKLGAFRDRVKDYVARTLPAEQFQRRLDVDDEVPLGAITKPVVREIERLEPHGPGNPPAMLVASHVKVAGEPRLLGRRGGHVSFYLAQEGASIRAVGFGMGELLEPVSKARTLSVAFTPQINAWQGNESVELVLKDVKLDP